jgi:hypothetical protein
MKRILLPSLLLISFSGIAQIPEDALKFSFFPQAGTARNMAIGGAMGSLGGDINATFVNPAGLGMYKTGEAVFTPSYFLNSNKADFRSTIEKSKKNTFTIGTIGAVYGSPKAYRKDQSHAFSLAFTQNASFNNTYTYQGYNNYSSGAEQWAEQVAYSNLEIDDILNAPEYAYGAAPALFTYLVDTFTIDGVLQVKSMPEFVLDEGKALLQKNTVTTRGGLYELSGGYAVNMKDKLLLGASVGIPIMSYTNNTTYTESDTSSNTNNNFGYYTFTDEYKTIGAGINVKLGAIYKPEEHIRLGIALHTPTYMVTLKDRRSSSIEAQTENYYGLLTANSTDFNGGTNGESSYSMITPWKAIISGSYVFREIEDVRKQKGFITADIEFVNHRGSRFFSANETPTADEVAYYKELNKVIQQEYKGNLNVRLGGELKFNTIMARLGAAYYGNPYKEKELKANKWLLSGGLGYRHHGFFIDLTYVHAFNKDVHFPYRLGDKSNTFAQVKNQRGNIVASVGFKF